MGPPLIPIPLLMGPPPMPMGPSAGPHWSHGSSPHPHPPPHGATSHAHGAAEAVVCEIIVASSHVASHAPSHSHSSPHPSHRTSHASHGASHAAHGASHAAHGASHAPHGPEASLGPVGAIGAVGPGGALAEGGGDVVEGHPGLCRGLGPSVGGAHALVKRPDAEVGYVLLPALLGGLEGVPGTLHQAPGLCVRVSVFEPGRSCELAGDTRHTDCAITIHLHLCAVPVLLPTDHDVVSHPPGASLKLLKKVNQA